MLARLKSTAFKAFKKSCQLVGGSGIGKIPGMMAIYRFIFRRLWVNRNYAEVQGGQMYVNPDGLPERYKKPFIDYITLGWEEATVKIFQDVVKKGDVVVDMGANMGFFTLLAAKLVGREGKVYSFEPNPTNYNLLLKNIAINGYDNVTAVQKAVSYRSGAEKLFISDDDIGNSTIYEYGEGRQTIEIETVAIDDFFADRETRIDAVKMDIEGAEMAALLGMERIVAQNRNMF